MRKKVRRYIHSEREMDSYMLELGSSDVKVAIRDGESLDAAKLTALLDTILDVEAFIAKVERKGIPFREFLAMRNEEGQLPRYQVELTEGARFIYSSSEFEDLKKEDEEAQRKRHEETLQNMPAEEITEEMKLFHPKGLSSMELYEPENLQALEERLVSYGLQLSDYHEANGALCRASEEDGASTELYTLRELIDFLRENGRKGIEIQRYKGLGEMNPEQLWETTMDPEVRTLIKVAVPDMVAADHMFSMLMGEEVPPRRAFIEQHALSIKNLDI
jgi:DNA gyrase subunit B